MALGCDPTKRTLDTGHSHLSRPSGYLHRVPFHIIRHSRCLCSRPYVVLAARAQTSSEPKAIGVPNPPNAQHVSCRRVSVGHISILPSNGVAEELHGSVRKRHLDDTCHFLRVSYQALVFRRGACDQAGKKVCNRTMQSCLKVQL